MKEIEKMLNKNKLDIDRIEVPEELETRLYSALNKISLAKPKRRSWKIRVAVACIIFLLIGYNFNAIAYYGKKLLGYDQIMNGTLKGLNELGKGQTIGKSYTFKNGLSLTLDGIMVDENQLLVFYTLRDPSGQIDKDSNIHITIKGANKEYKGNSGQGKINDEKTEIKWIYSFERPYLFDKTLDLNIQLAYDDTTEVGNISFTIDKDKAMGYTLKQNINETLKSNNTKIHLDSIVASPTKTVLYGSIQNIIELAKDHILGERLRPNHININLRGNGQELESQGVSITTDTNGIKFYSEYDALPEKLKSVQAYVESFSVDRDVNKKFNIKKGSEAQKIEVLERNITIDNIYELEGSTYVSITTTEDVILTQVGLIVDGERVSLRETIGSNIKKSEDGKTLHSRTLRFSKTGDNHQLSIEKMTYTEIYDKIIEIPIK
ncbi:hypothetical protein Curi_c18850 [Gottschalkia acidurici 9a]|uniref:DUF4179 domain-containing protein n=1 Tax=Gottschalkia acidurici (strain ATCC 7906 / DSM 604 / BCRC 14475 / CIP 104303 / KCTC 5404 / NCIMB 10678 / 9a) TaxID=1128398 RepID=K0B1V4_GOTA9|nr:DUF4179 domain-containing protein [Gottschalkia acidurici]AFS78890.1 hypothetical protein Curi_c18850 [Gottschalkia acidurici 9a]